MRIAIAGAGDLGTYLIEKLTEEGHEISLVDTRQEKLEELLSKYDIAVTKGSVLSYDNLVAVGAAAAHLFVAVTASEELNLMAAILAKRMGAERVVARIRHNKLIQHDDVFRFGELGIDDIISPDAVAAAEIEMLLDKRVFTDLITFAEGRFSVAGLVVEKSDHMIGKRLAELVCPHTPCHYVPIGLVRGEKTHIVADNLTLEAGDLAYFLAMQEGVSYLAKLARGHDRRVRRAMIVGGTRAGIETARRLQAKHYHVTMIEQLREYAEELAEWLPDVLVIHGSAQEPGFLEDHDIDEMDALIAATRDPEFNMVACLIAKRHEVPHTVALVKDVHYLNLTHEFGVDKLINKKMLAADYIVRHVKQGNVISIASIPGLLMETLEFVVRDNSLLAEKVIGDLELVRQTRVVIGGVLRSNKSLAVSNDLVLSPGDTVVAACHHSCRNEFQRLL